MPPQKGAQFERSGFAPKSIGTKFSSAKYFAFMGKMKAPTASKEGNTFLPGSIQLHLGNRHQSLVCLRL
jgi:hypothetical protein